MLASTQRALDEARAAAAAAVESAASSAHGASAAEGSARLAQALSELTLLRESNSALRGDAVAAVARSRTAEQRVEELQGSVVPLQQRVRVAEAEAAAISNELTRSREEIAMWRARLESVLSRCVDGTN